MLTFQRKPPMHALMSILYVIFFLIMSILPLQTADQFPRSTWVQLGTFKLVCTFQRLWTRILVWELASNAVSYVLVPLGELISTPKKVVTSSSTHWYKSLDRYSHVHVYESSSTRSSHVHVPYPVPIRRLNSRVRIRYEVLGAHMSTSDYWGSIQDDE